MLEEENGPPVWQERRSEVRVEVVEPVVKSEDERYNEALISMGFRRMS
jgi:hypothetical protein